MKEFVLDFLKLLANSVLIICFALMSFLLISNLFHYREVSYGYSTDLNNDANYNEYKKILKEVDKKMNSVDYKNNQYNNTAKPIYEYYSGCINALNKGSFAKFGEKESITALDVYNANNEILKDYNNSCIFYIPYSISNIYSKSKPNVSFDKTKELTSQKADIIIDNAEYLTESGLGNSSYSFVTDITRASIYNKVQNELDLTIDNYKMIALLLDDVADWYVDEYGGNS
ncbi:MAG: hypothetical protein ACI31R_03795 [Bacilli bacterium]